MKFSIIFVDKFYMDTLQVLEISLLNSKITVDLIYVCVSDYVFELITYFECISYKKRILWLQSVITHNILFSIRIPPLIE